MDLEENDAINFDDLLKKVLTLIWAKKQRVNFALIDHISKRMSDLVDKSVSKARVSLLSDTSFFLLESAFQLQVVSVSISSSAFLTKKNNKKIDNLTDMMRRLYLSVQTLQKNAKMKFQVLPAIGITLVLENYR